jgi:hypothetical protein
VDLSKTANNATIDLGYNIPNNDVMQVTVSAPSGSAYSWYWSSLKGGVLQKLPVKSLPILDLSDGAVPKSQGYYCLSVSGKVATRGIVFRVMSFANSKSGFLIGSPLAVTRDPSTIVVSEGNSAYFSVGVSGDAAAYYWYKVDGNGNRAYVTCSATPYLSLDATTVADSGSYMVVASDGGGYSVDSNTAGLVIIPKGD